MSGAHGSEAAQALAGRLGVDDLEDCLRFPRYFEIETVNACNARCTICTVGQWDRSRPKLMSLDLFRGFVEEAAGHADWIRTVCLNRDGEPTLDRQLPLRVRLLKEAGIGNVTLSTNGQLLDRELAGELMEAGLDDIMVSLDGITAPTFEDIRRGLSFERVMANTHALLDLRDRLRPGMTVRLRMVVLDRNRAEVDPWLAYWQPRAGPRDRVYAMPAHTWGNQLGAEIPKLVARYADQACVSLFSTIAMHSDGSVGLCGSDFLVRHHMGTFPAQTIREIWTGKQFSLARERHLSGRRNEIDMCRGCGLWDREYATAPAGPPNAEAPLPP